MQNGAVKPVFCHKKREDALNRAFHFAEFIADVKSFLILPAIVTEEEKRHMIECRLLYCLGKSFRTLKIDISRSSIETISRAMRRRDIYGE